MLDELPVHVQAPLGLAGLWPWRHQLALLVAGAEDDVDDPPAIELEEFLARRQGVAGEGLSAEEAEDVGGTEGSAPACPSGGVGGVGAMTRL